MATKPGQRLSRDQIAQYADVAARLRHLVSQRTLAKYRAQAAQGAHPRVDGVQLGGGAALAGRDPATLLVDARGRWQSDGADILAQVGQQLQDLYRARFGDVREVAGPGERIPVDAIRYWEDSLAAQGDVIDGRGTLRTEHGKLLLNIAPSDGSPPLTLEIGGKVVTAPGFPSEHIPGGVRYASAGESILAIEHALKQLAAKDGPHKDYAMNALARLDQIKGTREADLGRVGEVLRDAPADVIAALKKTKGEDAGYTAVKALTAMDAQRAWDDLVKEDATDGQRQLFFSKETNDETIKNTAKARDDVKRTWVFAGAGGNAVSGAEIVLRNTTKAEVTLVAKDQPAGLFQNGQFRSMVEAYGDPGVIERARAEGFVLEGSKSSKRLHMVVDTDLSIKRPEITTAADGSQRIELRTENKDGKLEPVYDTQATTKTPVVGDMFVSALGSPGQLPPEIGALALEARRTYRPDQHPVRIEADFATDSRYLGYTVHIRIGDTYRAFEVRGAASRYSFVPVEEFKRMGPNGRKALERIEAAGKHDAHSKSGNFDAGLGPTTSQTAQQHVEREKKANK
ncbi:MAG: hypothetical protein H0T89_32480, partial [Deltaproteobacteria bacterium]|nr:hypothetical protein [Deltaproteobacteria bacterium]